MAVYVAYGSGRKLTSRRLGAWVKADSVQVRGSGAWTDVGPDTYVRRGGCG